MSIFPLAADLMEPASCDALPDTPDPAMVLPIAFAAGLVLGLVLVFFRLRSTGHVLAFSLLPMIPVSVVVMTRNEAANIGPCLEALGRFDQVFVVDFGKRRRDR